MLSSIFLWIYILRITLELTGVQKQSEAPLLHVRVERIVRQKFQHHSQIKRWEPQAEHCKPFSGKVTPQLTHFFVFPVKLFFSDGPLEILLGAIPFDGSFVGLPFQSSHHLFCVSLPDGVAFESSISFSSSSKIAGFITGIWIAPSKILARSFIQKDPRDIAAFINAVEEFGE